MRQLWNDTDVERLVQRSAAFRAARAVLVMIDAAAASSIAARLLPRRLPARSLGILLLTASATHAMLIALLPGAVAPVGRFAFAVAGAAAGTLLLALSRRHNPKES